MFPPVFKPFLGMIDAQGLPVPDVGSINKEQDLIKTDYLKFAGRLDNIRVDQQTHPDNLHVTMTIDGVIIPNLQMPTRIYEDIEAGGHYDFYGLFNHSKNKSNNKGYVYAVKPADGEMIEVPSIRYGVQIYTFFSGALAAGLVLVVTWVLYFFGIGYTFRKSLTLDELLPLTTYSAFATAFLVLAFFLVNSFKMFKKTAVLDTWDSITPANLSSRFSKLHR